MPRTPCRWVWVARHGEYARVEPPGMCIARFYCEEGHVTFSLLPDCLASRLSSTLVAVEEAASAVEQRTTSLEEVAATLRPDIEVQGAVRWVRRRAVAVAIALKVLKASARRARRRGAHAGRGVRGAGRRRGAAGGARKRWGATQRDAAVCRVGRPLPRGRPRSTRSPTGSGRRPTVRGRLLRVPPEFSGRHEGAARG